MRDIDLKDKDIDDLHKRVDKAEQVIKSLQQNPAPTIPQYDLSLEG